MLLTLTVNCIPFRSRTHIKNRNSIKSRKKEDKIWRCGRQHPCAFCLRSSVGIVRQKESSHSLLRCWKEGQFQKDSRTQESGKRLWLQGPALGYTIFEEVSCQAALISEKTFIDSAEREKIKKFYLCAWVQLSKANAQLLPRYGPLGGSTTTRRYMITKTTNAFFELNYCSDR